MKFHGRRLSLWALFTSFDALEERTENYRHLRFENCLKYVPLHFQDCNAALGEV